MSNQLSIQAGLAVSGSGENTARSRSTEATPTPATKPVPLFVNPSFQFDPTVGIVVIEFHDAKGAVSNSIPSQRQLAAYRNHQATPPGEQTSAAPKPPQPASDKTSSG
jgi:hypothetical protein